VCQIRTNEKEIFSIIEVTIKAGEDFFLAGRQSGG
jgi:hypothetical protein